MRRNLIEEYRLRRRLARLESIILERSIGRGGGPSKAFILWDYLSQNGPKTATELQATDLRPDVTSNAALRFFLDNNLIVKNGNNYSANLGYHWDDVGVLPRTAAQELQQEIQNAQVIEDEPEAEAPVRGRRERTARAPREPRVRQVRQNLFSRKFEEVKAAVEAGQDPTVANEKGKTPLMFACGDTKGQSGEIIEYLLEHGANANDRDGNRPVLFACCKFGNSRGIKALVAHGANITALWKNSYPVIIAIDEGNVYTDALVSLINGEVCYRYDRLVNTFIGLNGDGKLSDDVYHAVIEKIISCSNSRTASGTIRMSNILFELSRSHKRYLLDLYINEGVMPDGDTYGRLSNMGIYGFHALRDAILMAIEGKLFVKNAYSFMKLADEVFDALGMDKSIIISFITPEYIRKADSDSVVEIIYQAVVSNKPGILDNVIKAKRKDLNYNYIIEIATGHYRDHYRYDSYNIEDSFIRQLCRILSNCLPSANNAYLNDYARYYVQSSSSKRLIEFLVDRGYGNILAEDISRSRISQLSSTFVSVMNENGIEIKPVEDASDEEKRNISNRRERSNAINRIRDSIESDEWSRSLERYVTEHPEILLDDSIQDFINTHIDSSLTARQLQRRIDRMPKEAETYDM